MVLVPFSLTATVVQPAAAAVGRTQASIVIALVRSSRSSSATVTREPAVPLNDTALPNWPVAAQVALAPRVPVSPAPMALAAVVPAFSLKAQAATAGRVSSYVTVLSVDVDARFWFPAASRARLALMLAV